MSKFYDVSVFKTFHKDMTVKAESPEEAKIIAYALNDNDEFDYDFEYCDDATRLEIEATEGRDPATWAHPEAANVSSKEDVDDVDYEYAKESLAKFDEFWNERNEQFKKLGVNEYLEKAAKE